MGDVRWVGQAMRELGVALRDMWRILPDLPDWIAWRIDAWTVRVQDQRRLSLPVADAWWWR